MLGSDSTEALNSKQRTPDLIYTEDRESMKVSDWKTDMVIKLYLLEIILPGMC